MGMVMVRNPNQLASDSDSLQADVMRFMAIIAFCLMAIMALVRNVAPIVPPPIPAKTPAASEAVAAKAATATAPPAASKPEVAPESAHNRLPAAPPAAADKGLSLRFASDQDFLRLVTKGDIEVFAFRTGDVLSLNQSFRFQPSAAPGQIYELMPETIPKLIGTALSQERTDTTAFLWGIRIPRRLEQQIQQFLNSGAVGELVINRYGEVRHEAST